LSGGQHWHGVLCDPLAASHDRQPLDLCLHHQHPVERVVVVLRKFRSGQRVLQTDRQGVEAVDLEFDTKVAIDR